MPVCIRHVVDSNVLRHVQIVQPASRVNSSAFHRRMISDLKALQIDLIAHKFVYGAQRSIHEDLGDTSESQTLSGTFWREPCLCYVDD